MSNLSVPLSMNCSLEQGGQNCFNEFILRPASFQALALNTLSFLSLGQRVSYESENSSALWPLLTCQSTSS